ncbi:MAG: GatB/YqeY domain-containing protein [Candidatus Zixiibacteriota bacterium]
MSLLDTLNEDLKIAMKAGDKARLEVVRGLKSDIKYKEIELKHPLTEEDVVAVLSSAAKKRRDSIEQFKAGGREDLAGKEAAELEIISHYLPKQLSDDELAGLVDAAIQASGATVPGDLGKVMKEVMPKVKGRADGNKLREMIAAKLVG